MLGRGRVAPLVLIGLAAGALALVSHAADLLARAERTTIDARFAVRGVRPTPRDIVVVAIDQDSLARLPRFPFSRSLYVRVIDRLHADHARVIAFDIEFNQPTTAAADNALIGAVSRARPVAFATTLIDQHGNSGVLGGPAAQKRIGASVGATAAMPDSGGVVRRLPFSVNGLPSLAVVIAKLTNGRTPGLAEFARGGPLINYLGPTRTFSTVSFVDVLDGRVGAAAFRNRDVIIGETAPSGQDLHPTPFGVMPGSEVQANAVATILGGFPLRDAPGWVTVALILTLGMVAPLASVRSGAAATLGVSLVGLLALSIGSQIAFNTGRVVDYSDSLVALGSSALATVSIDYVLQNRERNRLRELFAAFSPEVVDHVLTQSAVSGRVALPLPATAVIGGYRMQEIVGRGAMGVVYKATQLALERPVAVKVISPEHARNRLFRERFERESRLAASVEHANVIPIYEAGEDDGLLFIAMRYVDGVDLGMLVGRLGPLAPLRATAIIAQIAGALDAAHALTLVHRDVKPANILLTSDEPEHAYLTDFGIAKLASSHEVAMTGPGQWVGTVDYIAPEQLRGEPIDGRADIYALGGALFYALTGAVPYPLDSDLAKLASHLTAAPPVVTTHAPALAAFDPVVARAMAKQPGDRFATATEFAMAAVTAGQTATAL